MRILLAVSSMEGGGAERVAATLANAWSKRGDEVTLVVTFSGRGGCRYFLTEHVELVYLVDFWGRGHGWSKSRVSRLAALRQVLRDRSPSVVVSMLTNVNVAVILATLGLEVPVCVCERTHPLAEQELNLAWRALRRATYRAADIVVAQTRSGAEALRRCARVSKTVVVPNPLPGELETRQVRSGGTGPRRRLVAMGRLEWEKGFDRLVPLFGRLAPEFAEWDLRIFGDGSQRKALVAEVRRLSLEGRVVLPGWVTDPWSELERAHLFVLPSRWEGFPNALLEAMALGLPCVSYDCLAGPREITRDGRDAVLVPAGDEQALEAALRSLMSDDTMRRELGAKAARSVRERYALSKVLALWDDVFRSVGVFSGLPRRSP
jgi:GalNAc-alpha-(1->4)-GalNAc-alpha-(1->3)-diNAcBac-PP-undecaprenol alpha-1,4-N-acetyl-D-galactosaminyltransferase